MNNETIQDKYKYIEDSTLSQDCRTIFDLAERGRMDHELANKLVYDLLQSDTLTRSKSGGDSRQEDIYHGK